MTYRSWLFVPGDSERKIAKSAGTQADALILDLEDAVAPDAKPAARQTVAAALAEPAGTPRFVRLNALDTGMTEADLAAVHGARPDGYVLPKCEGRDDLEALSRMIEAAGGGDQPILAIATETARAVQRLMSTDWSHPRLIGLAWGAEDLSADLGAFSARDAEGRYRGPFRLARDAMLLAAKAAGVAAVDAPFTDFRDEAGLVGESEAALAVGFGAKLAIHPAQAGPINRAFTPTEAQADWARAVIDAMEAAGGGVAQLDGRMLDQPHLKQARAILARMPE